MALPSFRRRFGAVIAATAVGLGIGGGVIYHNKISTGGGLPAGTANLWMSATAGGSCTRSTSGVAFTQSTSCNTLQSAFNAAQAGDLVGVQANGSYGTQSITGAKSAPGVTFDLSLGTGVASMTPSFDQATSPRTCRSPCAQWVEFRNGTFSPGWNIDGTANGVPTHVIFRNIDSTGEEFFKGGSFVSIIGGSNHNWNAGSNCNPGAIHIEGNGSTGVTQTNFLVQGVTFHDITNIGNCAGGPNHLEMIRVDENASFVTLDSNTFLNDQPNSSVIFITDTSGGTSANWPHDVTIQNNFVGPMTGTGTFLNTNAVVGTCLNWIIRYNSFVQTPYADQNCTKNNFVIEGNAGSRGSGCTAGVTYTKNVWQWSTNSPCGGTDKIVIGTNFAIDQLGFADSANADMHITSSSPAYNSGNAADFPSTDFDGQTRPLGTIDAGADEIT